jgi:hypothetical protein
LARFRPPFTMHIGADHEQGQRAKCCSSNASGQSMEQTALQCKCLVYSSAPYENKTNCVSSCTATVSAGVNYLPMVVMEHLLSVVLTTSVRGAQTQEMRVHSEFISPSSATAPGPNGAGHWSSVHFFYFKQVAGCNPRKPNANAGLDILSTSRRVRLRQWLLKYLSSGNVGGETGGTRRCLFKSPSRPAAPELQALMCTFNKPTRHIVQGPT